MRLTARLSKKGSISLAAVECVRLPSPGKTYSPTTGKGDPIVQSN